jgi:hypothetical protein
MLTRNCIYSLIPLVNVLFFLPNAFPEEKLNLFCGFDFQTLHLWFGLSPMSSFVVTIVVSDKIVFPQSICRHTYDIASD